MAVSEKFKEENPWLIARYKTYELLGITDNPLTVALRVLSHFRDKKPEKIKLLKTLAQELNSSIETLRVAFPEGWYLNTADRSTWICVPPDAWSLVEDRAAD